MIVSHIAALTAKSKIIGCKGKLPWNLPSDFKYFRQKTSGHPIIMGRKTFESLPGLLKNRLHVVVTKQKNYKAPKEVKVFSDVSSALGFCKTQREAWGEEIFIIGGGEIYKQTLHRADKLYLTLIHKDFEGDTRYPDYEQDFIIADREDHFGEIPHSFCLFVPKKTPQ